MSQSTPASFDPNHGMVEFSPKTPRRNSTTSYAFSSASGKKRKSFSNLFQPALKKTKTKDTLTSLEVNTDIETNELFSTIKNDTSGVIDRLSIDENGIPISPFENTPNRDFDHNVNYQYRPELTLMNSGFHLLNNPTPRLHSIPASSMEETRKRKYVGSDRALLVKSYRKSTNVNLKNIGSNLLQKCKRIKSVKNFFVKIESESSHFPNSKFAAPQEETTSIVYANENEIVIASNPYIHIEENQEKEIFSILQISECLSEIHNLILLSSCKRSTTRGVVEPGSRTSSFIIDEEILGSLMYVQDNEPSSSRNYFSVTNESGEDLPIDISQLRLSQKLQSSSTQHLNLNLD